MKRSRLFSLHFYKEAAVLVIAAILYIMAVYPYYTHITHRYLFFLGISLLVAVQYFRVVIHERRVLWIRPFFMKVLFGFGNLPLSWWLSRKLMDYVSQFEDYNYNGVGMVIRDILPGLSVGDYNTLRSATFFLGISALILIVLFEIRLVYSIFKYRLVPGLDNRSDRISS